MSGSITPSEMRALHTEFRQNRQMTQRYTIKAIARLSNGSNTLWAESHAPDSAEALRMAQQFLEIATVNKLSGAVVISGDGNDALAIYSHGDAPYGWVPSV